MKTIITILLSFVFLIAAAQVKELEKDTSTVTESIKQLHYSFSSLKECQELVADINKMNGYPRQGALTYCKCTKNDTIYIIAVDPVLNRYEEILMSKESVIINGKEIDATKLDTEYKQLPIRTIKELDIKK